MWSLKRTHISMTLVDSYVVCEKKTHEMTLVDSYVVSKENTHFNDTGGSIGGL